MIRFEHRKANSYLSVFLAQLQLWIIFLIVRHADEGEIDTFNSKYVIGTYAVDDWLARSCCGAFTVRQLSLNFE
jgi:hypothetical protein